MPLVRVVGLSIFTSVELDADGNVERRFETPRGGTVDVADETLLERGLRHGWIVLADGNVDATAPAAPGDEASDGLEDLSAKELNAVAKSLGLSFPRTAKKADRVAAIRAVTPAPVEPEPAVETTGDSEPSDGLDNLDDELLAMAVDLEIEVPEDADRDTVLVAIRDATAPAPPATPGE